MIKQNYFEINPIYETLLRADIFHALDELLKTKEAKKVREALKAYNKSFPNPKKKSKNKNPRS